MKAITPEEFCEILAFVQKYHRFANYLSDEDYEQMKKDYHNMAKWKQYGLNIKYVDSVYDSRDNTIWLVKFRFGRNGYEFSANHFGVFREKPKGWRWNTLYDMCMGFLKGEMTDKQVKQFYVERKD